MKTQQPPLATNIKVSDTGHWLKTMVLGSSPASSTSPGYLSEMQVLGSCLGPTASENLGVGNSNVG